MDNTFLAPDIAKQLVADYRQLEQTLKETPRPKEVTVNRLPYKEFLLRLSAIGAWFGTDDIGEVIRILEQIASGEYTPTATLPANLKELVDDYEKELASAEADRGYQAAVSTQNIHRYLVAHPEVGAAASEAEEKLVPVTPPTEEIEQKPGEPVGEFLRRREVEEWTQILTKNGFDEQTAEQVAQTITTRLADQKPSSVKPSQLKSILASTINTFGIVPLEQTINNIVSDISVESTEPEPEEVVPREVSRPATRAAAVQSRPETTTAPVDRGGPLTQRQVLLLRLASREPSITNRFFAEMKNLPFFNPTQLLASIGGDEYIKQNPESGVALELYLKHGVTYQAFVKAVQEFRLQHPELADNHPVVTTLGQIGSFLERHEPSFAVSRPQEQIEISLAPVKEKPQSQGFAQGVRLVLGQDKQGKPKILRAQTLSLKKGLRALPEKIKNIVTYPISSTAKFFFGKPASALLSRVVLKKTEVRRVSFGIQKGIGKFTKGLFSKLAIFTRKLFTKPTFGWLRMPLATVFGVGMFTTPFPINVISGGASGSLLLAQGAHSTRSFGTFFRNLTTRTAFLRLQPFSFGLLGILIFGLPIIIAFLALTNINIAQGTFLEVGGGEYLGSPYIDVQKTISPKSLFQNSEVPCVAEYTITVRAKDVPLKDVVVKDSASFTKEGGGGELPSHSWSVPEITKESPWIQKYQLGLNENHKDSLVSNRVVVTASVAELEEPQIATIGQVIIVGNPPQDCPGGWPTPYGYITQGPCSTGPNSTHTYYCENGQPRNTWAIDIGGVGNDTPVHTTHQGLVVEVERIDRGVYGKYVKIRSTCQGKVFSSMYAHLNTISETIKEGQTITRGAYLGDTDDTGESEGAHLHYHFENLPMGPGLIPVTNEQWQKIFRCVDPSDGGCREGGSSIIRW